MRILILCLFISLLGVSCKSHKQNTPTIFNGESQFTSFTVDGLPHVVVDSAWKADLFGNHRAVVKVESMDQSKNIAVDLLWRRPDLRPETKKIIVVAAKNGKEIKNVSIKELIAEKGKIVFEATEGTSIYFIYYLPYKFRKGYSDARYGKSWNDYLPPVYEAEKAWLASLPITLNNLPKAKVLRFESRTRFDSFTPMGLIASKTEKEALRKKHSSAAVIFPEDRAFPIRLKNNLPIRWVQNGAANVFNGQAMKNEYYVWQLGIWAAHQKLNNVRLSFSDFQNGSAKINKNEITCFNQEGTNWDGKPLNLKVDIPKDDVQALWCGIQIPENAVKGLYKGKVTLTADGIKSQTIDVNILVKDQVLADKGDADLWRHSRLRWLNSTIGEDDKPVTPYNAIQINNNILEASGKTIKLGRNGFPNSIQINNREILAKPIQFIIETDKGELPFETKDFIYNKKEDGLVQWTSNLSQNGINLECIAYLEYDGYLRYKIRMSSSTKINIRNIKTISTYSPYASKYFMGIGYKGGLLPKVHHWNWEGPYDSYWVGNAKAGLHVEFRGGTYHGPLLKDYKTEPTPSWYNQGKGSVSVNSTSQNEAQVITSTGNFELNETGKSFELSLLITPVRPLNTSKHFSERYFQANPKGFEKAASEGANIANIHHAQKLNPMINYPFLVQDSLIKFIETQHQKNRKVKLYYTVRELTNYAEEIFAFNSLNGEILEPGVGYGLPWQMEHLIDGYKPAWYTEMPGETSDASVVTSGFSRLINYYLEGLRWMLENYKIDGIYLDDVSFDRSVMKRMRKIMETYRPGALIDLHSNTEYSIGPANQYTDYFPYIDRLWFGEHFWYNKMTADEWFVTFSGIPFGQMSEMLQDGGNRYLGMVYGASGRHSYGAISPIPVWQLWDSFGIKDAKMLGYWDEDCPVKTNQPNVKATAYVKSDKTLISIGNFDDKVHEIELAIDWKQLGLDQNSCSINAPYILDFQEQKIINLNDKIKIDPKKGLLLIVSKQR